MGLWPIVRKHRMLSGLAAALAISLVVCLAAGLDVFHGVRTLLSDQLFKAAAVQRDTPAAGDIVIVAIDDHSLTELGEFSSWPRTYHASLVDDLKADGARLIVFDILFSETTPSDGALAAAIAEAGNVILPYGYSRVTYGTTAAGRSISLEDRIEPCDTLKEPALTLGHAVMLPDEDGIVRRVPLYLGSGEAPQPSLALASVASYLRRPQVTDGPIANGTVPLAGRSIPVDAYGNMLINYGDEVEGLTRFTEVSYSDVLAGTAGPEVFRGKIVLIGVTATGLGDTFWTPLGEVMRGVELHAAAMETVLTARFLHPVPMWGDLLVIVFLALLAGTFVQKLRIPWAIAAAAGLVIVYLVTAGVWFHQGVMMDLLFPPLAVAAAGAAVNVMQVVCERAEKRDITQTFGRYVSPEIAGKILTAQRQDALDLQGVSRDITALYVDARHYTGLMESNAPETVFRSLDLYMKAMIAAIQHHGGIINKFTGDGLLAIWNAPVEEDDHAARAVRAALTCQRAVREVRESGAVGLAMEFGIGVMTGVAYVGTIGTRDRMEYSVFGDVVNTASRLSNEAPGNRVWTSQETYRRVNGRFALEKVGEKMLKGRHQPLAVYEVRENGEGVNIP